MDWKEQLSLLKQSLFPEETLDAPKAEAPTAAAGHRFERWLRGGWVPSLHLRIPESLVRTLGLEHGDLIEYDASGRISIVEKRGEYIPRVEVRFGILESDGDEWVIRSFVSQYGGEILPLYHEGKPLVLRFSKRNELFERLRLEDGCLVDAAFWAKQPEKPLIIYRHLTFENKKFSQHFTSYGKTKRKYGEDTISAEEGEVVRGKRVLIVGGDPRHRTFERRISRFGGETAALPGDISIGNKEKLEREIEKADVVLIMIRMIRHQTFWDAVAACRRLKKPHWVVESMGVKSVFLGAAAALNSD